MIRSPHWFANKLPSAQRRLTRRLRAATRKTGDDGFVLLESVVSIGLITVVTAALGVFFVTTSQTTNHLRARQEAIQLADSGIEKIRSYAPNSLKTGRDEESVKNQYIAGKAGPAALSDVLKRMSSEPYSIPADDRQSAHQHSFPRLHSARLLVIGRSG